MAIPEFHQALGTPKKANTRKRRTRGIVPSKLSESKLADRIFGEQTGSRRFDPPTCTFRSDEAPGSNEHRPPDLKPLPAKAVPGGRRRMRITTALAAGLISLSMPAIVPEAAAAQRYIAGSGALTAVWANDGGDKVTQGDLRAASGPLVLNTVWNGSRIALFGARNEVVSFNLVLEAARKTADGISVRFDKLTGPGGFVIKGDPTPSRPETFNWLERDIELFVVDYLQIRGLSVLSYQTYDERHIPERMRRPISGGTAQGGWSDRPDADAFYPDIAVPIEVRKTFDVAAGQNQSVWADVYIPKNAPPGAYSGTVVVTDDGNKVFSVPVTLTVRSFTLPDQPTARTMVYTGYDDVAKRYTGLSWPAAGSREDSLTRLVMRRQMLVAHRHKISLIDDNEGATPWPYDKPRPEWVPRLTGKLFTKDYGYKGPGEGVGNGVFAIGTYGRWRDLWGVSKSAVWAHSDKWEAWFRKYAPSAERFLYLTDESDNYAETQSWANWLDSNPGIGRALKSFTTADLPIARTELPGVDIVASWFDVGEPSLWGTAVNGFRSARDKDVYFYNGQRPASGTFATEDDGTALRQLAWGQYKMGIDRWFFWQATYYEDYQGGRGHTNVFKTAQTFGSKPTFDRVTGMTGWNSSNGDGVLFYPGKDAIFPAESLDLNGPIASLRLKHWRRGIQDVDYLALARAVDPVRTQAVIAAMVPKVMWEVGVTDPSDPTWVLAPVSWSSNPAVWETARRELADIIEGK
jgi:hypothetical protein